jgi:hypothetical protein
MISGPFRSFTGVHQLFAIKAPSADAMSLEASQGTPHALLGIVGAGVHRHDCLRQVVGPVFVELNLSVERFLAKPYGQRARSHDGV